MYCSSKKDDQPIIDIIGGDSIEDTRYCIHTCTYNLVN